MNSSQGTGKDVVNDSKTAIDKQMDEEMEHDEDSEKPLV
jgi:hypothetical protein